MRGYMWLPVATSGQMCATLSNTLVNVKFREIHTDGRHRERPNVFNFSKETKDTILFDTVVKFEVIAFLLMIINWTQTWNRPKTSYLLLLNNATPMDIIISIIPIHPLKCVQ